ncbi:MAG: hypothetical protein K9W44_00480 [Candidatus Lokiarchaeota archaeon]|nr:hypothetical protein [Candidatus Harpocratesius repetitus]
MDEKDKYIKELEDLLTEMMKPIKNVPFNLVIKGFSGHDVILFDMNNSKDRELLDLLIEGAQDALNNAYSQGIKVKRTNEVGNYIEEYVLNSLNKVGLHASRPKTKRGTHKAGGYPDIFILDKYKRPTYLEIKSYNIKNYQTTQRSFYLSPSTEKDGFKVIHDARHLILSFQIEKKKIEDKEITFIPVHWTIFDTKYLKGQIKHEFNASNKQMYLNEAILAKGSIEK